MKLHSFPPQPCQSGPFHPAAGSWRKALCETASCGSPRLPPPFHPHLCPGGKPFLATHAPGARGSRRASLRERGSQESPGGGVKRGATGCTRHLKMTLHPGLSLFLLIVRDPRGQRSVLNFSSSLGSSSLFSISATPKGWGEKALTLCKGYHQNRQVG